MALDPVPSSLRKQGSILINLDFRFLGQGAHFCIALSGGLDSVVLLHLMKEFRNKNPSVKLRAVHVHHGLNKNADEWRQFCAQLCADYKIDFVTKNVEVKIENGESLEALARDRRYAVFADILNENEVLLTAQHQDDQAETFLIQLMRGAGVRGLSSMPVEKKLGAGILLRPLLNYTRAQIEEYARKNQLNWVEDSSNENNQFNRNYLRNEIIPELKKRWPQVSASITRSAEHCANAESLLNEYLEHDYAQCVNDKNQLSIEKIIEFSELRQRAILRYWITQQNFLMPSTKHLDEIFRTVVLASSDAKPKFTYGNSVISRVKKHLQIEKSPVFHEL